MAIGHCRLKSRRRILFPDELDELQDLWIPPQCIEGVQRLCERAIVIGRVDVAVAGPAHLHLVLVLAAFLTRHEVVLGNNAARHLPTAQCAEDEFRFARRHQGRM